MSMCVLTVQEITVEENNRTQMWCHVPFVLPSDIQIVWRYAEVRKVILLWNILFTIYKLPFQLSVLNAQYPINPCVRPTKSNRRVQIFKYL